MKFETRENITEWYLGLIHTGVLGAPSKMKHVCAAFDESTKTYTVTMPVSFWRTADADFKRAQNALKEKHREGPSRTWDNRIGDPYAYFARRYL